MLRFTGIALQTLKDRLGPQCTKRWGGLDGSHSRSFSMWWSCTGSDAGPDCIAFAHADYEQAPQNLDAWQAEMFDNWPFPKEGWTLRACTKHADLFTDYPCEAEPE